MEGNLSLGRENNQMNKKMMWGVENQEVFLEVLAQTPSRSPPKRTVQTVVKNVLHFYAAVLD